MDGDSGDDFMNFLLDDDDDDDEISILFLAVVDTILDVQRASYYVRDRL
jgi:hypothetical protein